MTTRRARADSPPMLEAKTIALPYGAIQTDAFKWSVVLELYRVAIEDGDDGAGESGEGKCRKKRKNRREYEMRPY
jgi:hypothetical protein